MNMKEFTDTELANERWKAIEGYENIYEVSSLGRVRSLKYGKVRVMRPKKNGSGYLKVNLYKNYKVKNASIHRLVAQAFIKNDDETKIYINHRDECKQNNRVSNLEYCTPKYNNTYNDLHHRRVTKRNNYKYPKIKKLYNPDLSIKQNIELFKTNGIECSYTTVKRLRKDLGLTKKYTKRS